MHKNIKWEVENLILTYVTVEAFIREKKNKDKTVFLYFNSILIAKKVDRVVTNVKDKKRYMSS